MKMTRRELSINQVIDKFIFKNNQSTVFLVSTYYPKKTYGPT